MPHMRDAIFQKAVLRQRPVRLPNHPQLPRPSEEYAGERFFSASAARVSFSKRGGLEFDFFFTSNSSLLTDDDLRRFPVRRRRATNQTSTVALSTREAHSPVSSNSTIIGDAAGGLFGPPRDCAPTRGSRPPQAAFPISVVSVF
jgi:hypothetical protein